MQLIKKLKLNELEVHSFTTSLTKEEKQTVNGAFGASAYCYGSDRPIETHFCPEARNTHVRGDCGGRNPTSEPQIAPPIPQEGDPDREPGWDDSIMFVGGALVVGGAAVALTFFGGGATCLVGGAVGGGLATAH